MNDIITYLKRRTAETFQKLDASVTSTSAVDQLLHDFDRWSNPFSAIDSQYKLISYLKRKEIYSQPEPHTLGTRWEIQRDSLTNKQKQVQVNNIFYYVPIQKTLQLVFSNADARQLLEKWRSNVSYAGSVDVVEDWLDSENGCKLQSYCHASFPNSLPVFIQLYFDEVETVNPLGSKTGIHKLGCFYFIRVEHISLLYF